LVIFDSIAQISPIFTFLILNTSCFSIGPSVFISKNSEALSPTNLIDNLPSNLLPLYGYTSIVYSVVDKSPIESLHYPQLLPPKLGSNLASLSYLSV